MPNLIHEKLEHLLQKQPMKHLTYPIEHLYFHKTMKYLTQEAPTKIIHLYSQTNNKMKNLPMPSITKPLHLGT
jgi:hypothetical protein